jgi:opacity protein-like surface antigen
MLIRQLIGSISLSILAGGFPLAAQKWEFGAGAGGSFYIDKTVESTRGDSEAGFKPGVAVSAWLGNTISDHVGGEIRYSFQTGDARLVSRGSSVGMPVYTHQIHYDVLIYASGKDAKVRPFFAVGGGLKGYQGRGDGQATQPLLQFAALTPTTQWVPVISAGGGVKWRASDNVSVRAEVRDYISQFPKEVILPAPPNTISGWLNNFVVMFGLSYHF